MNKSLTTSSGEAGKPCHYKEIVGSRRNHGCAFITKHYSEALSSKYQVTDKNVRATDPDCALYHRFANLLWPAEAGQKKLKMKSNG